MEVDAEGEAGVLVLQLRQVAGIFGVDPVEANRNILGDMIEEAAEEGGEIFPLGRAPDSTVIVVVMLKLHPRDQEQRLGDLPRHGRRDLIEVVVVKIQELIVRVVAAILIVNLEQEPLGWMHPDFVIQPMGGVVPVVQPGTTAGYARLGFRETTILVDV